MVLTVLLDLVNRWTQWAISTLGYAGLGAGDVSGKRLPTYPVGGGPAAGGQPHAARALYPDRHHPSWMRWVPAPERCFSTGWATGWARSAYVGL